LRTALELEPLHAPAHRELGLLAYREGKWYEAQRTLTRAAEMDTADPLAPLFLGRLQMDSGESGEARRFFELAVERDPELAEARYLLAEALRQQGELEAAEEHFRAVLRLEPGLREAQGGLVLVALDRNDEVAASRLLEEAGSRAAVFPLRLATARLLARSGRFEGALRELQLAREEEILDPRAVRREPDFRPLHRDARFRRLVRVGD
jgi:tetratricopeptide (TPR) repeat protein